MDQRKAKYKALFTKAFACSEIKKKKEKEKKTVKCRIISKVQCNIHK